MSILDHTVAYIARKFLAAPQRERDRPMEVLCLGMPRTGTDSLRNALKILGYDLVYHGSTAFTRQGDWTLWNMACMAKFRGSGKFERREWDRLLGDCMAVTDSPCMVFSRELVEAYPQAKIILTERPFDDWLSSTRAMFLSPTRKFVLYLIAMFSMETWVMAHTHFRLIMPEQLPGRSREALYKTYQEHNALIRELVPKERLLEYHVSQGWGPLCEFLGKEVPPRPMPSGNTTSEFKEQNENRQRLIFAKAIRNASIFMIACVSLGGIGFARYMYARSKRRI